MLTLMICTLMVLFFRNWQAIMIVVTVFQLITCIAIPVAFYKLRLSEPNLERQFRMPFGKSLSIFIFILVSYLLAQAGLKAVILAFVMHVLLFAVYCVSFYKKDLRSMMSAFLSSWSIFLYLLLAIVYALWAQEHVLLEPIHLALFIVGTVVSFVFLIRQKVWPSHEQ